MNTYQGLKQRGELDDYDSSDVSINMNTYQGLKPCQLLSLLPDRWLVSINMNTYQGLKHILALQFLKEFEVSINMNTYQGLKRYARNRRKVHTRFN